jgi:hypothetical protein
LEIIAAANRCTSRGRGGRPDYIDVDLNGLADAGYGPETK